VFLGFYFYEIINPKCFFCNKNDSHIYAIRRRVSRSRNIRYILFNFLLIQAITAIGTTIAASTASPIRSKQHFFLAAAL